MKKQLPHILSLSTVAKSRLFEIQAVELKFSNGIDRTYERFRSFNRDSVMAIAIEGEDLLLIREYAVGTELYELGFVKGGMDAGETPKQSANRELQEEIGFGARKMEPLRSLYSAPSHMFGLMHVFVAEDLYPSKLEGDEPEPLELVHYPLAKIDELLASLDFAEARNLSALFLLKAYLNKNTEK